MLYQPDFDAALYPTLLFKYITQCLDSVFLQDIPESEYEVICVNDCYPDNSREIVIEYQKKHANLRLIEHEKNKMLGAARNTGLRVARGEYVWFIDSDDYIKENVFGKLLKIVEENELEILHFNSLRVTNDGKLSTGFYAQHPDTSIITGFEYLNDTEIPYWKKPVMAWTKIYLREFLLKNDLFFTKEFWEDNLQTLKSLLKVSRFQYFSENIYFWRLNEKSMMNKNSLAGIKLADQIRYCCACLDLLENYSDMPFYNEIKETYLWVEPKNVLFLPLKEKFLYYQRIKTFDRNIFKKYKSFKKHFVYTHPLLIFPFAILRPLYQPKRKAINNCNLP